MRTTPATRLPADIYDPAAAVAAAASRTIPQQIAHWARIGRALEMSPQVNHRAIAQVLAGDGSYDLLGEREQAVVRGAWAERSDALGAALNFAEEFAAAGQSYSEAAPDGSVVIRDGA